MKIKLPKEIRECVEKDHALQHEIQNLSQVSFQLSREYWKEMKEKYKGYNFKMAKVNNETGELILPFQDEDDGLDELRKKVRDA